MIGAKLDRRWALFLGLLSVLVLLVGYTVLSHMQHLSNPADKTIPNWPQMREGVQKLVETNSRSGERWILVDSYATATRLFLGLGIGVVGSLVLGMLMGCFAFIEALLYPPLSFLAKVPPIALLAVFFVIVGTGENMYISMIAFGVLPSLSQSVFLAVKDVPEELRFKAYSLGASNAEIVSSVLFPHVLPKLLDAVRLQIGPAMVYLIAAEMVVGDVGFGYRIRLQFKLLNMNVVYPYIVILGAFGFCVDSLLRRLQGYFCPWYAKGSI